MSQSSIIGATLLAGFVLYLAAQDRLKVYAAVLWGDTKAPLPSSHVVPLAAPGGAAPGGAAPGVPSLPGIGGAGGGMMDLLPSLGEAATLALPLL